MSIKKRGFRWWLLRIATGLIGLIIIGLLGTTVNASIRDGRIYNADLPVGSQLIDVNGRHIHVHIQGEDQAGPAVVFIGCLGCNSAIWQAVQPIFLNLPAPSPSIRPVTPGATPAQYSCPKRWPMTSLRC